MMPVESQLVRHAFIGVAIGLPLGAAYFAALRRNVRLYIDGGFGRNAIALHLLRLAIVTVLFVFLARVGPGALLGGLSAFLLARTLALRLGRKPA
jgi:F1F0 ATPase subunit 2